MKYVYEKGMDLRKLIKNMKKGDILEVGGFDILDLEKFMQECGIDDIISVKGKFSVLGGIFTKQEFNELNIPDMFSEIIRIRKVG